MNINNSWLLMLAVPSLLALHYDHSAEHFNAWLPCINTLSQVKNIYFLVQNMDDGLNVPVCIL